MRGPEVRYGGVTLLTSPEGGRYPAGHSLLFLGTEGAVLLGPCLVAGRRGGAGGDIEFIAVTHAHEDHVAGLHLFPEVPVVVHPAEAGALRDPETLLAGFGMADAEADVFRQQLRE